MKDIDNIRVEPIKEWFGMPYWGEQSTLVAIKAYHAAFRLLMIAIVTIFFTETFIMLLFFMLPYIPPKIKAILDSSLLTALVFPVFYLVLYRPLILQIAERKRIEERNRELIQQIQDEAAKVRNLRGLLPICASCKKIRNDEEYRELLTKYSKDNAEVFSICSTCPECAKKII